MISIRNHVRMAGQREFAHQFCRHSQRSHVSFGLFFSCFTLLALIGIPATKVNISLLLFRFIFLVHYLRFPVHCAVMGGSIDLVRWLVDTHLCPVSVTRGSKGQLLSVQTSARRTLLDVAMTGRPKMDILAYLVSKGLSLTDVKDPSLPTKTLEAMLKCSNAGQLIMHNNNSFRATSPVGVAVIANDDVDMMDAEDHDESVTTATSSDHCALCCERPMDCVLTPCGHQICCNECAQQIQTCPICKVKCSALRIFRQ